MAGKIIKVSGPLVIADGMTDAKMYDMARVSKERLIGEIVELKGDLASIQVYEDTGGLGPGDPVETTGLPLSVELGPGLIESIFDGIQRPLDMIYGKIGNLITRGVDIPGLDRSQIGRASGKHKPSGVNEDAPNQIQRLLRAICQQHILRICRDSIFVHRVSQEFLQ